VCVAVPSPIVEVIPGVLPMAKVRHGEALVDCCLAYVPEAAVGDYVLVQHGFAINRMTAQEASEVLSAFAELAAFRADAR